MANKSKNINIPARVVLGAVNTSKDFDELCSWICIRNLYNNGVYTHVTQKRIRDDFRVGKEKGKEIFESFSNSRFFTMETEDRVRINSLRSRSAKFDKHNRCYFSDVCFKIPVGSYSHLEVKNLLREMVICYFINAVERKEGLICRSGNAYHAPVRSYITMKQLATTLNVSVSTISRLTDKMHSKGLIKKLPAVWVNDADERSHKEVQYVLAMYGRKSFTFTDKKGISHIVQPCKYHVMDRDVSESFKHKIYDFKYTNCPFIEDGICTIPQLYGF